MRTKQHFKWFGSLFSGYAIPSNYERGTSKHFVFFDFPEAVVQLVWMPTKLCVLYVLSKSIGNLGPTTRCLILTM